jgi:hypothetical protein
VIDPGVAGFIARRARIARCAWSSRRRPLRLEIAALPRGVRALESQAQPEHRAEVRRLRLAGPDAPRSVRRHGARHRRLPGMVAPGRALTRRPPCSELRSHLESSEIDASAIEPR